MNWFEFSGRAIYLTKSESTVLLQKPDIKTYNNDSEYQYAEKYIELV